MPSRDQHRREPATTKSQIQQILDGLDPLLREAASDVDPTLLAWSLSLSPLERLRVSSRAASTLGRFRRVTPEAG